MSTTTQTAHTPGPWTFETVPTSSGQCHKIGPFPWKGGRQNHACIYVDYPGRGPEEAELLANATLIAAAPDLLEALKWAEHLISTAANTGIPIVSEPECLRAIKAALRKAEVEREF